MIYFDLEVTQDFIRFLSIKQGLSENTILSYTGHVKRFFRFLDGRVPTNILTEEYLYLLKQYQTNHSVNTVMGALIQLQKYYDDRHLHIKFLDGFKYLKVENKPIEVLTVDEIKRILRTQLVYRKTGNVRQSDHIYLFFTELLAYTGCRFSEIAQMRVSQVRYDALSIIKTKNYLPRTVYIPIPLAEKLERYIKDKKAEDLVVSNSQGKVMYPGEFLINFKARCDMARIKKNVYPHLLRHSFATQLAISNVKAEAIMEILGHKTMETTMKYVHLGDETLKKETFRHPLFKETLPSRSILEEIKRTIESFNLDHDTRFFYRMQETESSLALDIHAK